MKYILSLFLLSLLVLSACAPTVHTTTPLDAIKGTYTSKNNDDYGEEQQLQAFGSLEEYLSFASSSSSGYYYGGIGLTRGFAMDDMAVMEMAVDSVAMPAPMPAVTTKVGANTVDFEYEESYYEGDGFSETNNQVQGVDEADIIKTDGNYVYTITDRTLFIVEAGEDAQVVSTLKLDGYANGLFIQGNKLAIFGSEYDEDIYDVIGFRPRNDMTYFHVYDMSDKENLVLEEEYSFEGYYFNARMIDGQIYFVVQSSPEYRTDYPLPIIYKDDVVTTLPVDRVMWYPGNYNYAQLMTIHSIDLSGSNDLESLSVAVDNPQTLYMSHNNIYLLGSEYISEYEIEQDVMKELLGPKLTDEDKNLIAVIKDVDDRVLSQGEKDQKILQIYYNRGDSLSSSEQKQFVKDVDAELNKRIKAIEYFSYTTIFKVEVDEGKLDYVASGKAPGSIVNQFSLDEYDQHLRIATTVEARWSRLGERTDSYTNVFTYDKDLDMVGELTELAPTERIYSTRFIQDRLYMVTFKQVDPFFVIDLSNPKEPEVLGDLKIPGFSRYLHPYDENHLIGIGQEATELGRTTGLKISIFNVEDVENPIEVAKFVTDERYASSNALYEHKAFLFSREKNLLVIPAYNYGWDDDADRYNGAFVFDISTEDIELRGLIDHSQGGDYYQQVERSLYIDDLLYTKSPYLLRVNELETLEGVADVELKQETKFPTY